MIGEIQERRSGCKLISLEKQGNEGRGKNDRSGHFRLLVAGNLVQAVSECAIANLIVILDVTEKIVCREMLRRPAMHPSPPMRVDTVVDIRAGKRLSQLCQRSEVAVIAMPVAGEQGKERVMEVVAPLRSDAP